LPEIIKSLISIATIIVILIILTTATKTVHTKEESYKEK
jgi:hypothetical protein